jgi:dephospho-CoA kinase
MTHVIGLTGGIACGKSLVAGFLKEMGVPVVDADQLARQVVTPPSAALAHIAEQFGPSVLQEDGALDRERLAEIVFADPLARARMEAIIHPEIARAMELEVASHREKGTPHLVYEAALLVETGLYRRLDGLIVVTAAPQQQIERLMAWRPLTREEARARLEAQLPLSDKVRHADVVIENQGSPEQARRATERAWVRLLRTLSRGRTRTGHGGMP